MANIQSHPIICFEDNYVLERVGVWAAKSHRQTNRASSSNFSPPNQKVVSAAGSCREKSPSACRSHCQNELGLSSEITPPDELVSHAVTSRRRATRLSWGFGGEITPPDQVRPQAVKSGCRGTIEITPPDQVRPQAVKSGRRGTIKITLPDQVRPHAVKSDRRTQGPQRLDHQTFDRLLVSLYKPEKARKSAEKAAS
ncbi:hypothetical protein B0H12DRAFT_1079639 [Mycena haematopus]|nr:hypothetical protein B0H12DRAFT_1079639 [Mycena haematopus]